MLWIDKLFLTTADLDTIDGEVAEVASSNGLVVDGPNGLIQRAIEDAGREIIRRMIGFAGFLAGDSLSANHLQAVFNVGTPAVQRSRVLLDNVVVTGANAGTWSDVYNWAVYVALHKFYNAAANRNMEDRYAAKRDGYKKQLQWEVGPQFRQTGLPIVYKPLAAPGAFFAHSAGTFAISSVTGAGTLSTSVDVAITYVDQAQYTNNESNPSAITNVTLASGNVIHADLTNLNPPNGLGNAQDISLAIITPLNASGWNLYVGPAGGALYLQNTTPIPMTTRVYSMTGNPVFSGMAIGLGQYPNQRLTMQDTVNRG